MRARGVRLSGREGSSAAVCGLLLAAAAISVIATASARGQEAGSARPDAPGEGGRLRGTVVVYLRPVPHTPAAVGASAPSGAPAAIIRQEGLAFRPHVTAIPKGSTVEFSNGDPVFHNVFSLSKAASFDLGRYPRGSSRSVRFDVPGLVKVFCHIHSDMSAVILVLDNRYFARPDAGGQYRIEGIPAGEYTAVAWHERARPLSRRVRIESGGDAVLDLRIPLTEQAHGV